MSGDLCFKSRKPCDIQGMNNLIYRLYIIAITSKISFSSRETSIISKEGEDLSPFVLRVSQETFIQLKSWAFRSSMISSRVTPWEMFRSTTRGVFSPGSWYVWFSHFFSSKITTILCNTLRNTLRHVKFALLYTHIPLSKGGYLGSSYPLSPKHN